MKITCLGCGGTKVIASKPCIVCRGVGYLEHVVVSIVDTESLVCDDINTRQLKGITKYGTTVALNPLDLKAWLQHAYEECLDQAVYLKRAIQQIERDSSHDRKSM